MHGRVATKPAARAQLYRGCDASALQDWTRPMEDIAHDVFEILNSTPTRAQPRTRAAVRDVIAIASSAARRGLCLPSERKKNQLHGSMERAAAGGARILDIYKRPLRRPRLLLWPFAGARSAASSTFARRDVSPFVRFDIVLWMSAREIVKLATPPDRSPPNSAQLVFSPVSYESEPLAGIDIGIENQMGESRAGTVAEIGNRTEIKNEGDDEDRAI
ncbi:hypothetical protein EVAR_22254_1 [Eumeta japonica]|uniref:Uncharacterized protein n=1 Tax=Eumeta variegata TaxID=151549 RepID=A0A4C1UBS0_EUMVA|nr:hypothetical protein EVAR_22254_1 [Eumeta japonica]